MRALAALGLLAVVAGAGSFVLVRQVHTLRALRAEMAHQRAAVVAAPREPEIGAVERRAAQLLETRLRQRYPGESALPQVVGLLAEWAGTTGLEVVALELSAGTPAAAVQAPARSPDDLTVNEIQFTLVVRHQYEELVRFLDLLGRLPMYVALRSLEIERKDHALTTRMGFVVLQWRA